jgi:hypothetical protein
VVGGDLLQWEPPQAKVVLVDARHEGAQGIERFGRYNSEAQGRVRQRAAAAAPRLLQSGGFGGSREGSAGGSGSGPNRRFH